MPGPLFPTLQAMGSLSTPVAPFPPPAAPTPAALAAKGGKEVKGAVAVAAGELL